MIKTNELVVDIRVAQSLVNSVLVRSCVDIDLLSCGLGLYTIHGRTLCKMRTVEIV